MLLKIVKEDADVCYLLMHGRLDMAGVSEIEIQFAELTGSARRSIVIDISEVPFVASLGMRMFLSAAKRLRDNDKKLVLLKPEKMVSEALHIAGFQHLITMAGDESELNALLK